MTEDFRHRFTETWPNGQRYCAACKRTRRPDLEDEDCTSLLRLALDRALDALREIDGFCNKVNSGEFDAKGTIQSIQHTARGAARAASKTEEG